MTAADVEHRPHPAKYNDDILAVIAGHLRKGWKVLDPMAGVGRVHDLAVLAGVRTWGVELEADRIDLGRPLSAGSGAALQWGPDYRRLHQEIWDAVVPLASQRVILNIKNHVRDGQVQRVAEWHTRYLIGAHDLELDAIEPIPATGVPHGANADARVDHELVLVFSRPDAEQVSLWGDVL